MDKYRSERMKEILACCSLTIRPPFIIFLFASSDFGIQLTTQIKQWHTATDNKSTTDHNGGQPQTTICNQRQPYNTTRDNHIIQSETTINNQIQPYNTTRDNHIQPKTIRDNHIIHSESQRQPETTI